MDRKKENKTEDICMQAVQREGLALDYVREQQPEVCIAVGKIPDMGLQAVQREGLALEYVKEQEREISTAVDKAKKSRPKGPRM